MHKSGNNSVSNTDKGQGALIPGTSDQEPVVTCGTPHFSTPFFIVWFIRIDWAQTRLGLVMDLSTTLGRGLAIGRVVCLLRYLTKSHDVGVVAVVVVVVVVVVVAGLIDT